MRMVRLNGTKLDVEATSTAISYDGAPSIHTSMRDVTAQKLAADSLTEAAELRRLAVVVRDAHDAVTVQDLAGHTTAWNPGATRIYGWTEAEALQLNVRDRIPVALRDEALARLHALSQADVLVPYQTQRLTKSGKTVEVWITATALVNPVGQVYAIATTERASNKSNDQK
jgi:two-component system CheB/CheR fusion protein